MYKLSIVEKAKRYDDIIERLKDFQFEYRFSSFSDVIGDKFPELKESKESKDKRIKKAISDILLTDSDEIRKILDANNILMQDVYAWLEKQGEKSDEWKEGDVVRYGGILALVINGRNISQWRLIGVEDMFKLVNNKGE